jgi:choline dehydrogenase-like flavoprotein
VVGGGYPGVMAADRLTQRDRVTVTVIDPRPEFVERIRLRWDWPKNNKRQLLLPAKRDHSLA